MRTTFKNELIHKAGAIFVFCLLGLWPFFLSAQQVDTAWVRRYNGPGNGDDAAAKMAVDAQGNVYVAGTSKGDGTGTDIIILKYDPNGNLIWERRYNGPANGNDGARDIELDGRGNVYVCGSSIGIGTADDYTLIRYDTSGNQLWVARFNQGPSGFCHTGYCYEGNGPNIAEHIAIDSSGSVYVTGTSYTGGLRTYDWVTLRYDLDGNLLVGGFTVHVADGFDDWGRRVVIGPDNNVFSAGGSNAGSGRVIKFKGPVLWTKVFITVPRNMVLDSYGNSYLCGYGPGGDPSMDYAIFKSDSSGNLLWLRFYNGPGNEIDQANAVAVDDKGNVYVTGVSAGIGTIYDYATVKYDSAGNQLWAARYNNDSANYTDAARAIKLDVNRNVYVSGNSYNAAINLDYATIKYDSQGVEKWVHRYDGLGNNSDQVADLAVDGGNNVYVTGSSYGDTTGVDIVTIKYIQYLKGDLNGDGALALADIALQLNCVFLQEGSCPARVADLNCDGYMSPADVVVLLLTFFASATPPC